MPDVGTGTTIAYGTSSYAANITGVTIDGQEVPVIDASHFGTTDFREKIFGKLKEPPQLNVDMIFDPNEPPPVGAAVETITVTFPIPAGDSSGAMNILAPIASLNISVYRPTITPTFNILSETILRMTSRLNRKQMP